MANMTDRTAVAQIMNAICVSSGSAPTFPTTRNLYLLTAQGSNISNGTQATSGNCPGYTASGTTITFGLNSGGTSVSTNAPTWTATGTWGTITSVEIWDSIPKRWFQGALTANITGVTSGDTVQFAIGAVTADASQW